MGHIKGLALISVVKALRDQRSRARQVLADDLQGYLSDRIFPSRWYPEKDLMELLEALVAILPSRPDIWEWLGAQGANADFTSVYSAFIRVGRPETVLQRFPKIWRLYHDVGTANVETEGTTAVVTIGGDLTQREDFCRLQAGHVRRLLELSGGRDVQVRVAAVQTGDLPARLEISWHAADGE